MSYRPKIRNINIQPTTHEGQPVFIMYDSLRLTEAMIALPQFLGPVVLLCDGQHTISEMDTLLKSEYGLDLPHGTIEQVLEQFETALLLEGGHFEQTCQQLMADYHAAPFRQPALAGGSYPTEPHALQRLLQNYIAKVDPITPLSANCRAIISPHIDYPRGGHVYARVWAGAAEMVKQAELVIILATDHNGGLGKLTLTEQNYASPLGVLPTDKALVKQLANILGPAAAYSEELHHLNEWSIELVFVWLQYIRQLHNPAPLAVVPILCGSFHHYMLGRADITQADYLPPFIELLQKEMRQRRTLIVASGDLAHLGPAFDGPPLSAADHAQMKLDDEILTRTIAQGNANQFFELMKAGQYQRNVCGLSPFYLTLRLLEQSQGHVLSYDRCPADNENSSYVSVSGMILE